jgi:hypothetical protein
MSRENPTGSTNKIASVSYYFVLFIASILLRQAENSNRVLNDISASFGYLFSYFDEDSSRTLEVGEIESGIDSLDGMRYAERVRNAFDQLMHSGISELSYTDMNTILSNAESFLTYLAQGNLEAATIYVDHIMSLLEASLGQKSGEQTILHDAVEVITNTYIDRNNGIDTRIEGYNLRLVNAIPAILEDHYSDINRARELYLLVLLPLLARLLRSVKKRASQLQSIASRRLATRGLTREEKNRNTEAIKEAQGVRTKASILIRQADGTMVKYPGENTPNES